LTHLLLQWSNFHCRITKFGRASVLYSFILVFFGVLFGRNTLFIIPLIFRQLFNLFLTPISFS
jgi:hypothetical protein